MSALPVIIFGAALNSDGSPSAALLNRVHSALVFGTTHNSVLYIPTGGVPQNGKTEADVMVSCLLEAGIAPEHILAEPTAGDTFDSAVACTHLLRQAGYSTPSPIAVVSSPLHVPRCVLLMRLMGWKVQTVPFLRAQPHAPNMRKKLLRIAHECLALPWDALLVLGWRIVRR
ncbi:hypothetical protein CSR02_11760 [Acetobacter pomorum]|uniref:DUF218 domain-containing protein n=1 Tax=Acetobacter pomorum TaxID=65959 RepID=A0A2G4RAQ4_9PROT|nr:YdcF family protein [Acetobacter pomorum]PHY93651.1 hypothetical protein CSR02_11760 [Acetobacter pomorum]GBR51427.1 hypothetical protein AA11825_1977 [Acetobacter pomorum DSM 11825]